MKVPEPLFFLPDPSNQTIRAVDWLQCKLGAVPDFVFCVALYST